MNRTIFYRSFLSLAAVVMLASLLASPAAAAGNRQASGHGNLTVSDGLRTFSFTAVQHADGTVTGDAELKSRAQGFRDHYKIDCLKVEGNNRAIVSGPLAKSTDSEFEGLIGLFAVEDNGEGGNAPTDRMSLVFLLEPPDSCSNYVFSDFDGLMVPIEAGNIQVNP